MIQYPKELAYILGFEISKIRKVIGNINSYYDGFSKIKYDKFGNPKIKNGEIQKRHFKYSIGDLRILQNLLLSRVLKDVPILSNLKGGRLGESGTKNAKTHRGNQFIFQTDIQSFYPSISRAMVFYALRNKGFSKQVANIITDLTVINSDDSYRGETLPQGASTSPILSNIVFERVVKRMLDLYEGLDIELTTWIDDVTISSNQDFNDKLQDTIEIIGRNGFKVSRKKTTYRHGKTVITGVLIGHSTMKVTDSFRKKGKEELTDLQLIGREAYKDYVYRVDKNKI